VIVATGIAWRSLGVPRVEALVGAGVFYGAAGSETTAMAGRDVFVVGAGNSAGQAALHLARNARHVTLVVRRDNLPHSMSDYLIKEIEATPVITVRLETEVIEAHGGDRLDGLTLRDKQADRPGGTGSGGRAVRADRRRAMHPVAPESGSARGRLHPDRARHRPGRLASVPVAARPGAPAARDLRPRRVRGRRRQVPLDQEGRLRGRRRRDGRAHRA
jgi:cation diffusion facilitator CzcD-associated flavoprotein CzcO